ncbi:hypothetical protein [Brevibacillus centrosporus]|jgi:hypothetical protein|uniref:hypothetical protein n=1 Tax=Brevibacillus TaxID=55080 RepID=UPI0039881660
MTWLQIVALLACPLMMLLCMKGMFSKKGCHTAHGKQEIVSDDIQQLKNKVTELSEQNRNLINEIQSIKHDKV